MENPLTPGDREAVSTKLVSHIRQRDNLIVQKRETATTFTKHIKECNGVINDLCEQLDGTAVQPALPGTHEGDPE